MKARIDDPETSHEAAAASAESSGKLCNRIVELARAAGERGITVAEAANVLPRYRLNSITPRFAELIESGQLLRVPNGTGEPTNRHPEGRPRYMTRFDPETKRNVIVHWVLEFAPSPDQQEEEE